MAQFMYALSNKSNYVALGRKLQTLGVEFKSNGVKGAIGYKIPGITPALLTDILAHLRPEKKLAAYPFYLDIENINASTSNQAMQQQVSQLENACTMTLNKIKQASLQAPKDKLTMDLLTTTPANNKVIYAYLKQNRVKFTSYVGMAGIIIEFDRDEVGGLESSYFVKSTLYSAAGKEPETSDTDHEDSTDIGAVLAGFTLLYEHSVDLSKEYFPPPCMSVTGMGTKNMDPAVVKRMSRRSALGGIFTGGSSVKPFGS